MTAGRPCCVGVLFFSTCSSALLLSDLPTPSFVIDMAAVHSKFASSRIPPIALPHSPTDGPTKLVAVELPTLPNTPGKDGVVSYPEWFDDSLDPVNLWNDDDASPNEAACGSICYGYVHCSVRKSLVDANTETSSTRLVELDYVPIPAVAATEASLGLQLVLGLNNHHVGSYYWARSAGSGAAMEAPGLVLTSGDDDGASDPGVIPSESMPRHTPYSILEWQSASMAECNSNDGKRSEWVRFLRAGDSVQLRPLIRASVFAVALLPRVYGVSSQGRPLGSELRVVCQWQRVP